MNDLLTTYLLAKEGNITNLLNIIHADSPIVRMGLLILLILIVSFLINLLLSQSILSSGYRIFVAPGVILHELSHAFLCLLTGAKITKMSFFEKNGGHVEHQPSKLPLIGQVLISLAPLFAGTIAIYFLSRKIGISDLHFSDLSWSKDSFVLFVKELFSGFNVHIAKNWIIIYLVLSIAVTMTPSVQDMRNTFFSIVIIGAILYLVIKYTKYSLLSVLIPSQVFALMLTVLILLIFGLLFSIVLYIVSKFIKPA